METPDTVPQTLSDVEIVPDVWPDDVRAWRAHLRLTRTAAARALNLSPDKLADYEAGRRQIPRVVWLAMTALAHGLDRDWRWPGKPEQNAQTVA